MILDAAVEQAQGVLAVEHLPAGRGGGPAKVLRVAAAAVVVSGERLRSLWAQMSAQAQAEIRRVQVERIKQLLVETDFPLKKIAELADAGTPREREKAPGEDHGFLWRLNAYWRFEQVGTGVLIECESVSLSRSVPLLVRPLVGPIANRIAREAMIRHPPAPFGRLRRRIHPAADGFGYRSDLFGGIAVHLLLSALFDGWAALGSKGEVFGFFIFWVLNLWVVIRGAESIKRLEALAAPLLLAVNSPKRRRVDENHRPTRLTCWNYQ